MASRVANDSTGLCRERAWSLVVLAVSSAVAAVLVRPEATFWECACAIAAVAAAAALLAAVAARRDVKRDLDSMLIATAGQPHGEALQRRAEGISSPRHRRRVARQLDALVNRAEVVPNREYFQTRLVRLHRNRLRQIATTLRRETLVPASAVARIHRFLWSSASPLVRYPADAERFSAWLRQIEIELETAAVTPRESQLAPAILTPSTPGRLNTHKAGRTPTTGRTP
jgi:hypothetical protein